MIEHARQWVQKSGRGRFRRTYSPRIWSARCSCGWRGEGYRGRFAWERARSDVLEHLDETR